MNKNMILKLLFACCIAGNPLLLLGQVQAVDLGLSVKWADRNLGSFENKHMNNTSGDYSFSWGELVDKYDYSTESVDGSTHGFEGYACDDYLYTSSCKWYPGRGDWNIIGHPQVDFTFTCDNLGDNISGTEYDAAKSQLGEGWRMPTRQEFQELIDKCTWTLEKHKKNAITHTTGYRITGPNGNSIFLPVGGIPRGFYRRGYNLWGGYYWTSEQVLETEEERKHLNYAWCVYFTKTEKPRIEKMLRYLGLHIRAVYDK